MKKEIKMCFHVCREGEKNKTVDLYPTFLAKEIITKMIINAITEKRDKAANVKQDQIKFEK